MTTVIYNRIFEVNMDLNKDELEITEPININDLINRGVEFKIKACDEAVNIGKDADVSNLLSEHLNFDCLNLKDEDDYNEGTPFAQLAQGMTNLIPNGKIKKKILSEGDREKPEELATVTIDYNAYIEYQAEPFDSTYARKRSHRFIIDNGEVIPGLDLAVQSMKLHEKSEFLIDSEYAYKNGCFSRIPPKSTVLFQVKLNEIINSGAIIKYNNLSSEEQKGFEEIYQYATALCEKGKVIYNNSDVKGAIKQYNLAATKLENVLLDNKEQQQKHAVLALRVYTNLLVGYTRMGEPKKGMENAEKIYALKEQNDIEIPWKVYLNHARCARLLFDHIKARQYLEAAQRLGGNNPDILNEFLNLENDVRKHRNMEKAMAKGLFN